MAGAIRHRGPDDEGVWIDEGVGIALSHRRLSIGEISHPSRQPATSKCGNYVIVCDGEIFNDLEIPLELAGGKLADLSSSSDLEEDRSDVETFLDAISAWGVETALKRSAGSFAFALWDRDAETLTLARDRMGEKPLYYGWQGGTFLFGSELKALKAHPAFGAEIDRNVLAPFFRVNFIPTPYSIYKEIKKLPPGAYLQISGTANQVGADLIPKYYWDLRGVADHGAKNAFIGGDRVAADELERLLIQSIRARMPEDLPVGAFLSGGIDSSAVAALMQSERSQPIITFTVGFEEDEYNEADHARAVAEHIGADHRELFVTAEDAIRVLPRLAEIYDEPFSDPAQIPAVLLSEMAKQHAKVCLTGDGGDELFGGFEVYVTTSQIYRKVGWIPHPVRLQLANTLKRMPGSIAYPLLKAGCRLQSEVWREAAPSHIQQRIATVLRFDSCEVLYRELSTHWKRPEEVILDLIEPKTIYTDPDQWIGLSECEHRMMYMDQTAYIPDGTLVKEDRAAMAASLETRAPFLDHRIVEFAWHLPLSMKIRDGQTKWLLRQVLYRHVPREILERPRMGLAVPIRDWLRGPLREWAESLLDGSRIREEGFLNPAPIREMWIAHLQGEHDWSAYLWHVLMFQIWLEAQR